MDYDGGFHEVEKDGELFLVYHHPKYRPMPQIKSPSSSAEVANHDHPPLPLFICPRERWRKGTHTDSRLVLINSSPESVLSGKVGGHHVLPLFWCNNKNFGDDYKECDSLICNVCGFLEKDPSYVCLRCNFVAHGRCVESPHTIKISRHHHRISRVSSLRYEKWPCGVCRQSIDGNYGAYTCKECDDYYAVHSKCALGKDVWDGEELKGVPEKDDMAKDAPPFCKVFEGVVHYFLHDHHLRVEKNILYDENKFCEACVMPIIEDEFYSCAECDFILHETCLKARRRIQHALHPHPLTLKATNNYVSSSCSACFRCCGGFVYECPKHECYFKLDVRCALISEPFDYQGHEHPLFLSLHPKEYVLCEVCKSKCNDSPLSCIKCAFIICIKCATLPYKVSWYKKDEHFLTLSWGEGRCEKYWCEECEDIVERLFYWCNDCCTILHTHCLFSREPYLKPGQVLKVGEKVFQILARCNISRPICYYCMKPCQGKRFTRDNLTVCSLSCASNYTYDYEED
ncbi:hypothetical protein HID58_051945 [Brassica napus]|uniref:Cysteine/Histidine-rich C1 domain family protein n=1 Tax=Brassica napus TaxID=3708 RepID=A0ABQ8AAK8_BRANA|nr:hypothetical protein HID58_051945 [Brassica napus]